MPQRLSEAMPLYFAYGANLDRAGMARRCPGSAALGPACLPDHRFLIMTDGYATVQAEAGAIVHGLLWTIAPADFAALDAFEEVGAGLYRRTVLPVRHGAQDHAAAVYLGTSTRVGRPRPGYMEAVVSAAEGCGMPESYLAELRTWLPGTRS